MSNVDNKVVTLANLAKFKDKLNTELASKFTDTAYFNLSDYNYEFDENIIKFFDVENLYNEVNSLIYGGTTGGSNITNHPILAVLYEINVNGELDKCLRYSFEIGSACNIDTGDYITSSTFVFSGMNIPVSCLTVQQVKDCSFDMSSSIGLLNRESLMIFEASTQDLLDYARDSDIQAMFK